jgi:hypothetical protein
MARMTAVLRATAGIRDNKNFLFLLRWAHDFSTANRG